MTKIGILSDSHGNIHDLEKAVEAMGEVDLIIHAGDYYPDAEQIKMMESIPVLGVKGNMDDYTDGPEVLKTAVEGHNILVAHGHKQGVNRDLKTLAKLARRNKCKIAIFGHTHKKELKMQDGVMLINPGSCARPRDGSRSFAILEIDGKKVNCDFIEF